MTFRHMMIVAALWAAGLCAAAWAQDRPASPWDGLKPAPPMLEVAERPWENAVAAGYTSVLSPGALIRMRSPTVRLFTNLSQAGAEPPSFVIIRTATGTRTIERGAEAPGADMAASWILCSFQGSKGWERLDAPWLLSLEKRPLSIRLTATGLELTFATADSGHIYSMPLYGYYKPPQEGNDLAAKNNLPSKGIRPWEWRSALPKDVIDRCDWWSSVGKAYPVGFQESFGVDPATDQITFRQDYRWMIVRDDWNTRPIRFATLSPVLGLAWKFPGFPMTFSSPIHDPDYFTAYGPFVGALDVDRLEITMKVLQYTNELEYLELPASLNQNQARALERIRRGMTEKFQKPGFRMDYGSNNFVWSMVQDVWYAKGLEFIDGELKDRAMASLREYFARDVIKAHTPFQGKFIVHGPGIGSWGNYGDAGKFATNMLQGIWGYGQYTGDWALIRERWAPFVQKYFITPEESNFATYGRNSIAEMGDEAPPCSAYARMAWAIGDYDAYLFGCYMYARELVHHYIKQVAGPYFYDHQPYNYFEPMPTHIYPTYIVTASTGWQVDGPIYGHGERQSSNRWVRFHDPDTGRFYRDHLADAVRKELEWYNTEGRKRGVYTVERYQNWDKRDQTHIITGLARLRSFLLGETYEQITQHAKIEDYVAYTPAEHVAVGYAYLRSAVPVQHRRLVPRDTPPSPMMLGLQRRSLEDHDKIAQEVYEGGRGFHLAWYLADKRDFANATQRRDSRRFGSIEGNFAEADVTWTGTWTGYGCRVRYAIAK